MSSIEKITLRHLKQPLIRPYRLSYRTFEEFEPYLIEVEDDRGQLGFADGHISPGSSSETRSGGWNFLRQMIQRSLGLNTAVAKSSILAHFEESKVAATALVTAIEVLEDHPILKVHGETQLRLLTPINALDPNGIGKEVEDWLAMGFRTFKIKVGKDVEADLERVAVIQRAVAGRATLRLDANRAYSREQGEQFARSLDPAGIELFEQPCDSDDWDANAAVAHVSTVPLMLDEPICTLDDIDRASGIKGVGYCKLKLKRFGSLERLDEGLLARSLRRARHDQQRWRVQRLLEAQRPSAATRIAVRRRRDSLAEGLSASARPCSDPTLHHRDAGVRTLIGTRRGKNGPRPPHGREQRPSAALSCPR